MRFHLPSIETLLSGAIKTFQRFAFSIASAIFGTFAVLGMIDVPYQYKEEFMSGYYRNLMVSILGLTLFTALSLFAEHRNYSLIKKSIILFIALAILVVYRLLLPPEMNFVDFFRFSMYCLAGHLLVSFLPFIGKNEPLAFWEYNKTLFLRILLAGLYTVVLWGGLAIALLAIDQLFNAKIDGEIYGKLFVILAGIFNTWFFLAGIPNLNDISVNETNYPKGLKIFTQFVLLPLITIYLSILYAYILKIIITAQWPDGWVSWLVLSFSVAGILSLLLIWPIRNEDENKWIKIYSRGFYFALFPLVILLFLSIRIRIIDYGITEGRYYVVVLALWLGGIAAYFLFSKIKSIKVIPISLFVIAFLSVHGPWSAFHISINSQLNRFKYYVEKNNLLKNEKIAGAKDSIPYKDNIQISETVRYLNDKAGYKIFQPYFNVNLDSIMVKDTLQTWIDKDVKIMKLMNLKMMNEYYQPDNSNIEFYYRLKSEQSLHIAGYSYYVSYNFWNPDKHTNKRFEVGDSAEVNLIDDGRKILLTFSDDTLTFNVSDLVKNLNAVQGTDTELSESKMSLTQEGKKRKAKILFRDITGTISPKKMKINDLNFDIYSGYK